MLRLALDQNFPKPLLAAIEPFLPVEPVLTAVHDIDPRLPDLNDRSLLIALSQRGWDGLVTNNYKMLWIPAEIAAIVATKVTIIAVERLGHDPLRAAGALLLELPGLIERIVPNRSNIFRLSYKRRQPEDGWHYLKEAAERRGQDASSLWKHLRPSASELETPVLE